MYVYRRPVSRFVSSRNVMIQATSRGETHLAGGAGMSQLSAGLAPQVFVYDVAAVRHLVSPLRVLEYSLNDARPLDGHSLSYITLVYFGKRCEAQPD